MSSCLSVDQSKYEVFADNRREVECVNVYLFNMVEAMLWFVADSCRMSCRYVFHK